MKTISRLLLTLVALLALTTQAWADYYVSGNGSGNWCNGEAWNIVDGLKMTESNGIYSITFANVAVPEEGSVYRFKIVLNNWTDAFGATSAVNDNIKLNRTLQGTSVNNMQVEVENITFTITATSDVTISFNPTDNTFMISTTGMKVGDDITVEPVEGKTNEWTFSMPASDVLLTPIYAKTAAFATEGTEPNVTTLAPTAAEGVIAGTTDPIIVEGTVATGQGQVMYAVTTDATTAPALSDFSTTVPTASAYDDATTVNVWYYIQGADTPEGQTATLENTFNDSEICATPIEVTLLTNKFDITFNALNTNTIEGQNGKGTVTVKTGDAAAVDKTADIDADHKLKAVKMGSTVTITTKEGYKFRKVEAKKGGAAPAEGPTLAQTLTTANMTVKVYFTYNDMNNTCEFLSNGDGTYTFQSGTGLVGGDSGKAKALVVENGKLVFKQNFYATIGQLWDKVGIAIIFDTSENTYSIWKGSNETLNPTLSKVEVNGTQIALTQQ